MTMADFIETNLETILVESDRFAATLEPAATGLTQPGLRNHAGQVLTTIANDMCSAQSPQEQGEKSRGQRPDAHPRLTDAAHVHATGRLTEGFTLPQMVSEYRALRATVIRRWSAEITAPGRAEIDELTRFNEAIDESLTNAIQHYAQRLEQLRELYIGALAHDLRNPLHGILMAAQAIAKREDSGASSARLAELIGQSGEHMQKLIQDLLDFTRTRLGRGLLIDLQAQDMAQLARQVTAQFQHGDEPGRIQLELPETLRGVWDGDRIQQVLSNLLGNALKYATPNTPIRLRAQAQGEQVLVEVHNQGPAIPAAAQRHLFDPLTRAVANEDKRHRDGLGLGLYIARQIAEAHGGRLTLSASSDEQGTTFTLVLPRESRLQPPHG